MAPKVEKYVTSGDPHPDTYSSIFVIVSDISFGNTYGIIF